jgi:hypothetical protein
MKESKPYNPSANTKKIDSTKLNSPKTLIIVKSSIGKVLMMRTGQT